MNRSLVNEILLKSISQSAFKIHHLSKSTLSSLQTLPDSRTNSFLNPLYNFLPNTQNPSKIVDNICTNLKERRSTLLDKGMIPHLGNQEVSRVLLRCQSDSFAALTFFNWVRNGTGVVPTIRNYCLMLHILAWSHNLPQTMKLLSELIELNRNKSEKVSIFEILVLCTKECIWEPVVFDMLLKAYLKAGLVWDGFVTFRKMVKLGFVPKIVSINFLLDGLLKLDQIDECWGIYEEMRKIGVRANTITFNILTHVICKSGDVDKVNEFLDKMEEEGFDPDIVTYNTLIDSYVRNGRLKDGLYLYNIMYIRHVMPDLITHTSLINGLCREGNVREAHKLFHRMIQIGLYPDVFSYNTLICGYINKGMMQEARTLLHDMIREGVPPNEFTCLVLIEGYRKKNMLISAVNLIVELQKFGVSVCRDLQIDLVVALCRVDKPFAAKSLWERMVQDGKEAHKLEIYNELIVSFCISSYVNEAIQLKDEMFFKNIKPSLITYRTIIECLSRLNRTTEGEVFMRDMVEFGIQPDTTICRSLIAGHCKEKNLNQAESLLSFFAEEFQVCDNECYNELFKVLCEEGDIGKSMEFQNRMQKFGFTPNCLSFKYAIDGLSRRTACGDAFIDE
ncbi:pentatricopeptide repeat-containing protein At5g40400 [Cynara cardunculus var. scolymus]|uniref:Pentatricopeptide repeat-containing protein n=1 Tax=Cynara cardunculus var. scolymus TaxID=59895 RepID=A0A118JWP5_CYNCS|nr:pentatricopeptide repeat-containing protein At5g40400 [Cynara cardunculus var. scolymus]XP_024994040.1 pentatricopeptide repeat-containing protein At5g40400 [Cynara cardunculus var. scolymus]KVH95141.1 Pentatricopeptide repeat-containing protein [Cynara cardunculus var. scolymus]